MAGAAQTAAVSGMRLALELILFPGFAFCALAGMVLSWLDRKVTARVQWRVGPPLLQPVYDLVKLLGKETIVPRDAFVFLAAPLIGLAGVTLVGLLVGQATLRPDLQTWGDLIAVAYLLTMLPLGTIIGAAASRNPLASLGASREMKLVLAYELPFILALAVAVIKADYALSLGEILKVQWRDGIAASSLSGTLALLIAVLVTQAKLGLVPFDMAEAETEIMGGTTIEYSGAPLAVIKLTKMMLLFVMPALVATLFLGGLRLDAGAYGVGMGALKVLALAVVATLIRNTNPRVRIDQALRFFWGPVAILGFVAVVCATLGY
ncbi:MAG TPA: NADH-quinone oxidoreductase subunit H [bacterium]|nr:NADH-quinone oxidoreductase subunit H [bacterium]